MLGIDIALLVAGAALIVVIAGAVGGRLEARTERRQRRLQGERNAEREKQRMLERCTVCSEPIDPAHDVWEQDQWWHLACYRDAVK